MRRIPAGRWALALALMMGWVAQIGLVMGREGFMEPRGLALWVDLEIFTSRAVWVGMSGIHLLALASFTLRRRETLSGWIVFLLLGFATFIELCVRGGEVPTHAKMLPAVVLFALLVGRFLRRGQAEEERDRWGHALALGMVGALFTLSAISKWSAMGWAWTSGDVHALLIFERGVGEVGLLADLRVWMAHQPGLCGLFAAGTLLVESTGCLLIFPATRRAWVLAAVAVLLGFMVLPGVGMNLSWILVLCALVWSRFGGAPEPSHAESAAA